jgi:hypothetical protein
MFANSRRTAILCLATAGTALLLGAALLGNQAPRQPRAVVHPTSRTIVSPSEGRRVETFFEVENTGTAELKLGETTYKCTCVVASVEPSVVKPGHKARINLEVRPPRAGQQDASVQVATNDPSKPTLTLEVKLQGNMRPPYVVDIPQGLYFARAQAGDSETLFVHTCEPEGGDPWLVASESTKPFIEVTLKNTRSRHANDIVYRRYEYEVRLADLPHEYGQFEGELQFRAGDKREVVYRVPVGGQIHPPVYSTPAHIIVSTDALAEPVDISLVISTDEPDFHLEVRADDYSAAGVEVSLAERLAPNRLRFQATFTQESDLSRLTSLRFLTNLARMREVRVPVSVRSIREPGI